MQVAYVLCTIALMYSHFYGLFIVLAQNFYLATVFLGSRTFGRGGEVRVGLGRWVVLQVLLLVLYLPELFHLLGQVLRPQGRAWVPPPSLGMVYDVFISYFGSPLLLVLLLTFSLLAAVALVRGGEAGKLWLLLAWFLTPVALPMAISLISEPMFTPKHGIAASPVLYLLAAKGVEVAGGVLSGTSFPGLPRVSKAGAVWLGTGVALVLLSSGVLWRYFEAVEKPQFREAARYLDAHAQPGDLVLLEARRPAGPILFDYYSENTSIEPELIRRSGIDEATRESIEEHDRVWAFRIRGWNLVKNNAFEGSHAPSVRARYEGLNLTLYEKEPSQD